MDVSSFVMGYHDYKDVWTPYVGENLECCREPSNVMDKYAVAVLVKGEIVGHLMHGSSGKFAKTIFYFFTNSCTAIVTGKPVNLGKGKGMQVPSTLKLNGSQVMLCTLRKALS